MNVASIGSDIHGTTFASQIGNLRARRSHRPRRLRVSLPVRTVRMFSLVRCVFKGRNVNTNETVAIKKMSMLRTRNGLPTSVIREAALLKRVGKVDNDNLIKYVRGGGDVPVACTRWCSCRLREVFSEQPSMDRQNIYFIFEYVERDLERYLKLNNPLTIEQIRVSPSTSRMLRVIDAVAFV